MMRAQLPGEQDADARAVLPGQDAQYVLSVQVLEGLRGRAAPPAQKGRQSHCRRQIEGS